jgi:PAS domain S-box-containing protein
MTGGAGKQTRRGVKNHLFARVILALELHPDRRRSLLIRYASAPLATLASAAVQALLLRDPSLAPFVFFYSGIALCAGLAGLGPGLLCVLISAPVGNWAFLAPARAWSSSPTALLAMGLFVAGGILVAFMCASFRAALLRMEVTSRELERRGELLRLAHDAIIVWRLDGAIEFWNEGAKDLYGFSVEEALGRVPRDLLRTKLPQPWAEIETALRAQHRWRGELEHRARDGRSVVVSSNMQLVRGEDAVERVLEANRDITAAKQADRRLRAIYDLELLGILYWTKDGRILDANDKFLEMTGYTRDDLRTGRLDWARMTPPEWRHLDERALEDFRMGGVSRAFEKEYIRKDGRRLPIFIGGVMLDEARVEGVAFVIDITERKQAERALQESRDALKLSDERKSEFLGMLSHELRNPLAAIRNALYVMGRSPPGGDQAARSKAVVERQVQQLARLTDDLLDLTRISRGKIRLKPELLDLTDAVRSTVDDHRGLFDKVGVHFEAVTADGPLPVSADPARVRQMIGNLLQNAAKFTPPGGHTTISVGRMDGFALVTIQDDGVGIPPEILPQLFEPFVQSERTLDRAVGGLGLGLTLVKGLAEQHGGDVSVQSAGVGKGATFVLRLPLERRRAPRLTPVTPPSGAFAGRVLVIEDNRDAAETMRDALELNGHEVEIAYTGPEGLAKARAFKPEVILCDIGLPLMDGYQVARSLRADPTTRHIRLIAVSGYAQPEDLEKARAAGFDLHMAKPFELTELESRMREVGAAP